MKKEIEMQLTSVLNIFKQTSALKDVGVYISELESGTLQVPEMIFALKKLSQYCQDNSGWYTEQNEIDEIIKKIELTSRQAEATAKNEAPSDRFWVSFREWLYTELPSQNWLYPQYVEYDNWDGGTYYLNLNFDHIFRQYLGVPYNNCYDDKDHCTFKNIKILIELLYKEFIQVNHRYDFTVRVNKMLSRFSLSYELKNGKLGKKGYKTTAKNLKIINFQMLESKIQWSEEKILGTEGLDKHTALNYITDSLQYLLSLINDLPDPQFNKKDVKQRCALMANSNENSKVYSVIQREVNEIQTIVNDYFDIRHNEYLSRITRSQREPLNDLIFIEYLYNRIYGLTHFIKIKYLQHNSDF